MASAADAHLVPDADSPKPFTRGDGLYKRFHLLPRFIYWGIHVSCLLVFWLGASTGDVLLCLATFWGRMFGITGGYHRYFAHRTYKTSRWFQFALALLGCSATQQGPLWWAGHHRNHHAHSDQPGLDPHTPRDGLWHAHQAWIFDDSMNATPLDRIRDFERYPELVWLNRWYPLPPLALAVLCFAIGGLSGLLWGFAISTVALWHSTYLINSLAHVWGTRRYETTDTSRNNLLLALLTLGEGWHNNHHHYQASTRQGFRWWEIDVTYYILRGFQALGLIWDIREPPAQVVDPDASAAVRRAA